MGAIKNRTEMRCRQGRAGAHKKKTVVGLLVSVKKTEQIYV